ncbi:MAG: PD-(D/E)XK nuclease family protein [Phycisphaerales bacterium]
MSQGTGQRDGEIERTMLGAGTSPATSAARWIVRTALDAGASDARSLDLSGWLVVVPGERAGRLLLKAIMAEARSLNRAIDPPAMATPGSMLERMFDAPDLPAKASPLVRRLAWARALAEAPRARVASLLPRSIEPTDEDWVRLGEVAVRLEDALAVGDVDFVRAGDAAERLGGQRDRFDALDAIAADVRDRLTAAGLVSPDERRRGLITRGRLRVRRVVVVAALELGALQRRGLDRAARELALEARRGAVAALVAADAERTSKFDRYGCATAAWIDADVALRDDAIHVAERPRDQAEIALRTIADRAATGLAADELTVALADPGLSAALRSAGQDAGVRFHDAAGEPLSASRPARLLQALLPWLRERRPADFAALLRLPIVDAAVRASGELQGDPVAALDDVIATAVPATLDVRCGAEAEGALVARAVAAADEMFGGLARADAPASAVSAALRRKPLQWTSDDRAALDAIDEIVDEISDIPESIAVPNAMRALELAVELIAARRLPQEPRDDAIEAVGWLELLFEPAPHLIAIGMNAEAIPGGARHDPFLPDSLRGALGLPTRETKLARDVAILEAIAGRAASLALVAGRSDHAGEPLSPSPLLARCRGQSLADRVRALADPSRALTRSRRWRRTSGSRSAFTIPEVPERAREIESVSVTALRDYLECPYRFWLKVVERLEEADDDVRELDPMNLGSLVHGALDRFAKDQASRDATSVRTIESAILRAFDDGVIEAHGSRLLPAVHFQVLTLRERLRRFAAWQASTRAAGWRIVDSERWLPRESAIEPPGVRRLLVRGRIDRIDLHEPSGRYRIIDYKTGDAGRAPREEHRGGERGDGPFIGLQLPLYRRFMAAALKVDASAIEVGYVRLPLDPALDGWIELDFTEAEHAEAWATALNVAQSIRAGTFPVAGKASDDDPFRFILQVPVFGGRSGDAGGVAESDA